jgi:type IV secretion system protein VirD4
MTSPTADRARSTLTSLACRATPAVDRLAARVAGRRPPAPTVNWAWPGIYLGHGLEGGAHGGVWTGPEHHALVIGPPRSGKTSAIVIPTLALHQGPAVATSTKHDLLHVTAWRRSHLGRCWLWDPTNTTAAMPGVEQLRWSPLQGCQSWDTAIARAWALATAARPGQNYSEASHWLERAQALLAPLFHAAALTGGDLAVVLSWLHRRELAHALNLLDYHHAHLAGDLLTGIAATDHREQSGIFSTADSILAAYRSQAALDAARHPNFDPDTFALSGDTVYLCAPGATQAQHAPLIVALLQHIRDAVTRRPRPWPPMIWALDEVANIAPIPDLPNVVADSAAQGLLILACLQDLSQARHRWGHAADGFLTLFPTKVILPGVADLHTLQTVSAIAGEIDVPRTTVTRPLLFSGGRASKSVHLERRPRLPISAIARGRPGQAILLSGAHPTGITLTPWFAEPKIRQSVQLHKDFTGDGGGA